MNAHKFKYIHMVLACDFLQKICLDYFNLFFNNLREREREREIEERDVFKSMDSFPCPFRLTVNGDARERNCVCVCVCVHCYSSGLLRLKRLNTSAPTPHRPHGSHTRVRLQCVNGCFMNFITAVSSI